MRPILQTVLFFAAFLITACHSMPNRITSVVLEDVENNIDNRPDSALAVLNSIDTLCIHSPRIMARYCLLRAIALDKNNQDDGSFVSKMEWAANWYSLHKGLKDQTLVYYYLADQQMDCGRFAEASVNFSRALDLANKCQDWFVSGMSARNLAKIYASSHDYFQALDLNRKSAIAFDKAEKPLHSLYSRMLLANSFYNTRQFDNCIALSDSVYYDALDQNQAGIAADVLLISAHAYILSSPPVPDSTLSKMNRARTQYPLNAQDQAIFAWALFLKGNQKDAEDQLANAYFLANDESDSLLVMPWDARIADMTNDYKRMVSIQEKMLLYTNRQLQSSAQRSVDKARAQYYQSQETNLSHTLQRERALALWIALLSLAIIISLYLSLRIRKIRGEQEIREQQARLEEKERANMILSDKLELYGSTVGETLDFGFDVLNRLSDAYYHPNTAREDVFKSIIKDYLEDVSSRSHLGSSIETNINIIHDDVLSKLRTEIPSLKEEDIKLFSYCLFGFSYKAINAFYPKSSSLNTSYSRVFRLRKAIENSGSEHADFFLSFLTRGVSKKLKEDA